MLTSILVVHRLNTEKAKDGVVLLLAADVHCILVAEATKSALDRQGYRRHLNRPEKINGS